MLRIYFAILLGLLAGSAQASHSLRFVTGEFNSFGTAIADQAPATSGPFAEVVHEVCAYIHYRCVIDQAPWRRALMMIEEGKADAIFAVFPTPPREGTIRFTPPLVTSSLNVYAHRSTPLRYRRPQDLTGRLVHVFGPSGASYAVGERLRGIASVHEENDNLRLIRKLNAGRYGSDPAIMSADSARLLIGRLGLSDVEDVGVFEYRGFGFGFSRMTGKDDEFQDFMAGLRALMADGTIPAIIHRHHLRLADSEWSLPIARKSGSKADCAAGCGVQ